MVRHLNQVIPSPHLQSINLLAEVTVNQGDILDQRKRGRRSPPVNQILTQIQVKLIQTPVVIADIEAILKDLSIRN